MNTSDQSLFPIDSAFKRRWDWEYVPIKYKNEDWEIVIGDKRYKWVDFQRAINDKLDDVVSGEDKKLGDWFVKAKYNEISQDTLLNKVLFYLWNDVCKDGEGDIFKLKATESADPVAVNFTQLFDETKDSTESPLQQLMRYLGVKPIVTPPSTNDKEGGDGNDDDDDANLIDNGVTYSFSINGGEAFDKREIALRTFLSYVEKFPEKTSPEIISEWRAVFKTPKRLIHSEEEYNQYLANAESEQQLQNKRSRFKQTVVNGPSGCKTTYYLWAVWGYNEQGVNAMNKFVSTVNNTSWGIHIDKLD
ncbi:MAG: hypothetical protein HUJ93_06775 [Bacteroidales bacterium]|nr:hypothetical protein [Bacteroidales bacterium]